MGRLRIEWIQGIELVQEHGSISRAAERLGISQSALSQRIASLEESIGLPLVIRSVVTTQGCRCNLTRAGKIVSQYGQKLRFINAKLRQELEHLSKSSC
jgi:molybdate transport repressor ModE-like protein